MNYLVLGNPDEERCREYTEVLNKRSINFRFIDYHDFIDNPYLIPNLEGRCFVRLMSPWQSQRLSNYFFETGDKSADLDYDAIKHSVFLKFAPNSTDGFRKFLDLIDGTVRRKIQTPVYLNPPSEIYMGRNKINMSQHFHENGIPHPRTHFCVTEPDQVYKLRDKFNYETLFIKIHSGSLGIGISYLTDDGFFTSVNMNQGIYEDLRDPKLLTEDKEIEKTLDFLIKMGCIYQEGIELGKVDSNNFDLRIYTLYGDVPLVDMRISPNKWTNGAKGAREVKDINTINNYLGEEHVNEAKRTALLVQDSLESKYLGVDIAFNSTLKKVYCLEANFLPGIDFPEDLHIYDEELKKNLAN